MCITYEEKRSTNLNNIQLVLLWGLIIGKRVAMLTGFAIKDSRFHVKEILRMIFKFRFQVCNYRIDEGCGERNGQLLWLKFKVK